jgi:multisubunit Na+/H+ antiporter MnhB subunit
VDESRFGHYTSYNERNNMDTAIYVIGGIIVVVAIFLFLTGRDNNPIDDWFNWENKKDK